MLQFLSFFGHQGGERGVLPRSICPLTNEVKPVKITNHEKIKYERNCREQIMRNIFGDQGNMERNFWEQGNSVKVNFGEHLHLFLSHKGTTINFHGEQGNMNPPPPPGRPSILVFHFRGTDSVPQLFRSSESFTDKLRSVNKRKSTF